ncbi:MAG: hypothetical protein PVI21_02770 [Candidatus Woesebacteria bacterium]|jgi:hypothetical protein
MRKIHVGIAYEGSADIDALKIIVRRILNICDLDFEPDTVHPETPGSGIIGYIEAYAQRFTDADVALPIYCTDQDKDKKSRREIIIAKLKKATPNTVDVSAIGVSIPHFEAWLITDEDAVKNTIGLPGGEPLPLSNLQPKDRLISLYQNYYEGDLSVADIRCRLASIMDLGQVQRNKDDFNHFVNDIKRAANIIKNNHRAER